jgi:hypothetical protein
MGTCEKVWNESNEYKVAKSTMFLNRIFLKNSWKYLKITFILFFKNINLKMKILKRLKYVVMEEKRYEWIVK